MDVYATFGHEQNNDYAMMLATGEIDCIENDLNNSIRDATYQRDESRLMHSLEAKRNLYDR